jgi:hypothetical protein
MAGQVRNANPVQVGVPTASDHAVRNNDSRLSDARTPTTHVHAATDVTSAQLSSSRMPQVLNDTRSLTGQTGTVATDASLLGNFRDITATGNITLSVPTNPTNHQVLHYTVLASGATRTVTLNASIINGSGVTFPLSIPSTKCGRFSMEYFGLLSAWVVTAAEVTP